jgi:hypothetical protein
VGHHIGGPSVSRLPVHGAKRSFNRYKAPL